LGTNELYIARWGGVVIVVVVPESPLGALRAETFKPGGNRMRRVVPWTSSTPTCGADERA